MIINYAIILWGIALVLGFISLIYEFFLYLRLSGSLQLNYLVFYVGLITGYFSAVTSFLFDLHMISDNSLGRSLLMVAVLFISYGSIKLIHMLYYVPESFLVAINKKRQ